MPEFRVIRYNERYNVYEGDKVILSAVKTESFFHSSIGFIDVLNSTPFALYTEKRRLFGTNSKTFLLYSERKKFSIEGKGEESSLQIGNMSYSLYNKLSGGKGFYIDNNPVGRHETIKADANGYDKKLTFSDQEINYKIFICLVIAIGKS